MYVMNIQKNGKQSLKALVALIHGIISYSCNTITIYNMHIQDNIHITHQSNSLYFYFTISISLYDVVVFKVRTSLEKRFVTDHLVVFLYIPPVSLPMHTPSGSLPSLYLVLSRTSMVQSMANHTVLPDTFAAGKRLLQKNVMIREKNIFIFF